MSSKQELVLSYDESLYWSLKKKFAKLNMEVIDLKDFLKMYKADSNSKFTQEQFMMMKKQLKVVRKYRDVLGNRISSMKTYKLMKGSESNE